MLLLKDRPWYIAPGYLSPVPLIFKMTVTKNWHVFLFVLFQCCSAHLVYCYKLTQIIVPDDLKSSDLISDQHTVIAAY